MRFLLVPVDVKVRAFESRLLLSCFAADAGYYVIFGASRSIYPNLDCIPKGVIFVKSISKNEYKTIKSRINKGFKVVSLDEEGLGSHNNKFNYLKQRTSSKTLDLASLVFTWGEDEAEVIKNNYTRYSNKIKVVGNPRVDLWNSKFKSIYKKKALDYRKKFGRYILIPSNFGVKRASSKKESDLLKKAWDLGTITNKKEEKEFISIRTHIKKSFEAYINLVNKMADEFNDINFIIRPHPAEDRDAYTNLKDFPNIKIIYKNSITPWILASELIIHNGCTSGLEAYLLGKPVVSYKPFKHPTYGKHISDGVSIRTYNLSEVTEACKNILQNPDYFGKNLRIWPKFNKIISISNDKLACEKIVDHLDSLDWPKNQTNDISIPKTKDFVKGEIEFAKRVLSKTNLFKYKYSNRYQKFPKSSLKEVNKLISEYQNISGKFKNVKASKIAHDLYYIRKE